MNRPLWRFACTQCGACCNRSPEVELSEAAPLADVFVFRLMFRLYTLPRAVKDYVGRRSDCEETAAQFYQSKRLLGTFAARKYPARGLHEGKVIDYMRYLVISAISIDAGTGQCSALVDRRCAIYDKRPLACRSAPFHYSRGDAFASSDLQAFVADPGYSCDTSERADVAIKDGQIVDHAIRQARSDALLVARRDRRWSEAIARRMKDARGGLPTLQDIEATAASAAATVSMRAAWQIATEIGLMKRSECDELVSAQAALIDGELAAAKCSPETRALLAEMRAEYRVS